MLTKLSIKGFKCFSSQINIDFAPITIFIGPNNSGKSAILQALLLLKQTIEAKTDEPALQISGQYFDFGTYKDIVSGNKLNRNVKIGTTIRTVGKEEHTYSWNIEFASRKKGRNIYVRHFETIMDNKTIITAKADNQGRFTLVELYLPRHLPLVPKPKKVTINKSKQIRRYFYLANFVLTPRHPYVILDALNIKLPAPHDKKTQKHYQALITRIHETYFSNKLERFFRRSSYIGPLRNYPQRVYAYTGQETNFVGARGENTYALLVKYLDKRSKHAKRFWNRLTKWFRNAGLATDIKPESLMQRYYEVKLCGTHSSNYENIADVGFGNSQVMPIIVDFILHPKDTLHIVEQPEIHLHPKAQCELGRLLLDANKYGNQSIIETHSLDLIIRLRKYISQGKLKVSDLKVYYVSQKDGMGKVTELTLGDDFSFSNWPKGFFEERYSETMEIIRRK